jgi:hypothetical protein
MQLQTPTTGHIGRLEERSCKWKSDGTGHFRLLTTKGLAEMLYVTEGTIR